MGGGHGHGSGSIDDLTSAKVAGTFIIIGLSLIGSLTPIFASKFSRTTAKRAHYLGFLQQCLLALGAGVIIGVAFLHVLPEGMEAVKEGGLGGEDEHAAHSETTATTTTEAPTTTTAFTMTTFTTTTMAPTTTTNGTNSTHDDHDDHDDHDHAEEKKDAHAHGYPYGALFVTIGLVVTYVIESELHRLIDSAKEATLKLHIVEGGIAVHSIIIGVAFGILSDVSVANTLMVALAFHQLCEGFAVGPLIVRGAKGTIHKILMVALFVLSTPAGIGIGALVYNYGDPDSKQSKLVQGVFECLAAGLLIYVGCVEFLGHMLVHNDVEHQAKNLEDQQSRHQHCHDHHDHSHGHGHGKVDPAEVIEIDAAVVDSTHPNAPVNGSASLCPSGSEAAAKENCGDKINFVQTWGHNGSANKDGQDGDAEIPMAEAAADACPEAPATADEVDDIKKDFLSTNPWFIRVVTYLLVITGVTAMAVIAKWA